MSDSHRYGPEFRANGNTVGDQNQNDVIALADGKFLVTWTDHSTDAIAGQIYNADGSTSGGEIGFTDPREDTGVNSGVITELTDGRFVLEYLDGTIPVANVYTSTGYPDISYYGQGDGFGLDDAQPGASDLAVTAIADGSFVVNFTLNGHTEGTTYPAHTPDDYQFPGYGDILDKDGDPLTQSDILGLSDGSNIEAGVVHDGSENYLVLLQSTPTATGIAQVKTASTDPFLHPQIAQLSDGDVVVAFVEAGGFTTVNVSRYHLTNAGFDSVAGYSDNIGSTDGSSPSIAAVGDGFVVAYTANKAAGSPDQSGTSINLLIYDGDADTSTSVVGVNLVTAGNQSNPHVAGLSDGRFVLTWDDPGVDAAQGDTSGYSVRAQVFDYRTAAVTLMGTAIGNDYVGTGFDDSLFGASGNDTLNGAAGNDTLGGGDNNDVLITGSGNDLLFGNDGNDSFIVSNAGAQVFESTGQGTDTVYAAVSYTLGAGQSVEYLGTTSQAGTAAIALTGNTVRQTLNGNAGADRFDGGGGGDTMIGHGGNDTYIVRNVLDQVIEANSGGSDTIYAGVSYTLGSGQSVDTMATTLQSGTTALNLTGNNNANHIFGNNGNNVITGGGGADLLYGYSGNDTIIGGAGADVIDTGNGRDVVKFTTITDSTSAAYDTVMTMNLNATDKFDFPVVPVSVHAEIVGGTLNTASFDTNLAAAIHDASEMAANQAVLFAPNSGSLAGHLFLIVDANHTAGYQAGDDYVVELIGTTGTLTTDDFM